MKILYMSHILSIHDFRFLEKLSSSPNNILLVALDRNNVPDFISNLNAIEYLTVPRPLPRYKLKYFLSFRSMLLAIRHIAYRIIENSPLFNKYFNERTIILHQEFRFLYYQYHLIKIIKKFQPDIIHAGWIQFDGLIAALTGFKPILIMPWGSDIHTIPFSSKKMFNRTKFVINQSSHIYCDCLHIKKKISEIVDFDEKQISIFPQIGINLALFNPKRNRDYILKNLNWQNKRVIIMTRSFYHVYGIQFFIMALPKILNAHPDTRVIMVGTGPDKEQIKEIVDSLDLEEFVHFTGFVPNEELAYYLNAAEIYISTSKSDGTSLSLLEAMACKLPVVVSDVPANCEWIQDGINGFIVPRSKVNPISDKINSLLSDKSLAEKMGKLNYNIAVEKGNRDINFSKLEKTYQDLTK